MKIVPQGIKPPVFRSDVRNDVVLLSIKADPDTLIGVMHEKLVEF